MPSISQITSSPCLSHSGGLPVRVRVRARARARVRARAGARVSFSGGLRKQPTPLGVPSR